MTHHSTKLLVRLFAASLLAASLVAACRTAASLAPASTPTPVPVAAPTQAEISQEAVLGEPFTLAYNSEIVLKDTDLRLRFENLLEDSRCPADVDCVWSGQVRLQLTAWTGKTASELIELSTLSGDREPDNLHNYEGYLIELLGVDPYPQAPEDRIPLENYRLTLLVSEAQ